MKSMNITDVCWQCASDQESRQMIYQSMERESVCVRCGRGYRISRLHFAKDDLDGRVVPDQEWPRSKVVAAVNAWRSWVLEPLVWWEKFQCWLTGSHQLAKCFGWTYCRRCLRVAPERGAPLAGWEPNGGNLYRPHKMMVDQGTFWRCAHGATGMRHGGNGLEWEDCERCGEADPAARARWIANNCAGSHE